MKELERYKLADAIEEYFDKYLFEVIQKNTKNASFVHVSIKRKDLLDEVLPQTD